MSGNLKFHIYRAENGVSEDVIIIYTEGIWTILFEWFTYFTSLVQLPMAEISNQTSNRCRSFLRKRLAFNPKILKPKVV